MSKTQVQRQSEVNRLQSQMNLEFKSAGLVPPSAFVDAFQQLLNQFVKAGGEVSQVFEVSGYPRKINLKLYPSHRQSMIMLQKI